MKRQKRVKLEQFVATSRQDPPPGPVPLFPPVVDGCALTRTVVGWSERRRITTSNHNFRVNGEC